MKKMLVKGVVGSLVAFSFISCAQTNEAKDKAFLGFMNELLPEGAQVKIVKSKPIDKSELKSYLVEIEYNGQKFTDIYFSDGVVFIEDKNNNSVITIKDKKSPKSIFMQEEIIPKLSAFIDNGSDYMIKIGNDKNKPTTVVFSDPECFFCLKKLNEIEEDLKTKNIVYILTPVHGKSAYEKIINIIKETKEAKDDAQKISILRKYYNPEIKTWNSIKEDELSKAFFEIGKIMSEFNINATPTIIEKVPVKN